MLYDRRDDGRSISELCQFDRTDDNGYNNSGWISFMVVDKAEER